MFRRPTKLEIKAIIIIAAMLLPLAYSMFNIRFS